MALALGRALRPALGPVGVLGRRPVSWKALAAPARTRPGGGGRTRPEQQRQAPWRSSGGTGSGSSSSSRSSGGSSRSSGGGGGSRSSGGSSNRSSGDSSSRSSGAGSSRSSGDSSSRHSSPRRRPGAEQAAAWEDEADDPRSGWRRPRGEDDEASQYTYPARPSKASLHEALQGEALYGVAPILAALSAGSRTPHALLLQEGLSAAGRKDAQALADIQRMAAAAGAAVRHVNKHDLNMLSSNRPHQGLVLDASPLPWQHLDELPAPEELQQPVDDTADPPAGDAGAGAEQLPVWLVLDEVMDPQNLGAMIRSAYCLGVSGVLACSRNCAPLSPVVSKASAGAAELMPLFSCRSMPRTLADAAFKGWAVVGAAAEEGALPVSAIAMDRPTLLVMGNEGYGLRPLVKRCCTQLVRIDMAASSAASGGRQQRQQLVDSLNVSVATGILLHQLLVARGSVRTRG